MKNKIVGLGMEFSYMDFRNISLYNFRSNHSVLNFDILMIDLNCILKEYRREKDHFSNDGYKYFKGKPLFDEVDSYALIEDFNRRKQEILELLAMGKTVYIIPPKDSLYSVYAGKFKQEKQISLFSLLPDGIIPVSGSGESMEVVTHDIYEKLFNVNGLLFEYHYYFDTQSKNKIDLGYIRNTKKIVSQAYVYDEGHLILFPVNFDSEIYPSEKKYRDIINSLLHVMDEIQEELNYSLEEFDLPKWTKKYNILEEKKIEFEIDSVTKKMENLEIQKEKLETSLISIQKYKLALVSSGKELETIVSQMLIELGFESRETDFNRADGIFIYKDTRLVIEIKGVSKSAGEKHAVQLEKWVSEFFEKYEVMPKAVLIVNGFRQKDISERNEAIFPKQMLDYSMKREHCLISTTQLLCLFVEIKRNSELKETLLQELFRTVGVYEKYEKPIEFLSNTI